MGAMCAIRSALATLVFLNACATQTPDDRMQAAIAESQRPTAAQLRVQTAGARMAMRDAEAARLDAAQRASPGSEATSGAAPTDDEYRYFCPSSSSSGLTPAEEQAACHRCVEEGVTDRTPVPRGIRRGDAGFMACRHRMDGERAEMKRLVEKVNAWQPRGYQDAGDGLEGLSDAELDSLPADSRAAIVRLTAIEADLTGTMVPSEKRDEAWAEIQGFVAMEKTCRSDPKCTGPRNARKAEESFRFNVLDPMCGADRLREKALADIAHERANPSGYVDKGLLHQAGADAQAYQEQLAQGAPAFIAARHHAWRGWRVECPTVP